MPAATVYDVAWKGASIVPPSFILTRDEARSAMLRGMIPRDCIVAWIPQARGYAVIAPPPRLPPGAAQRDKDAAYTLRSDAEPRETDTPTTHPTPASE